MKYVTYEITYNFTYAEPQAKTVVYENINILKFSIIMQKQYFCVVTPGPSIKCVCNIGFDFNAHSQYRKQDNCNMLGISSISSTINW